jgi:hypothetical protein
MPFIPADHSKGDTNTIGGYAAVHGRPAAFEGSDGMSYSVELVADRTDDEAEPWGAYIMFLRWRRQGEQGVEGHLETDFVAHGNTEREALDALGEISLADVRALLEARLAAARGPDNTRRWWDVMRDESTT